MRVNSSHTESEHPQLPPQFWMLMGYGGVMLFSVHLVCLVTVHVDMGQFGNSLTKQTTTQAWSLIQQL